MAFAERLQQLIDLIPSELRSIIQWARDGGKLDDTEHDDLDYYDPDFPDSTPESQAWRA